jgi:WD40 repeat protein
MSNQTRLSNPFPGLRPFEPEENHLFFGRDGQSDELLRRLGQNRFLAVVGTSGSGKSSLVRAGLLPILHGGFMEGGSSHWRVAVFRPGADPIGNLAEALSQPGVLRDEEIPKGDNPVPVQIAITEATLRRGSPGLVEVVRQSRLPKGENLLLVVDQFEELFRFKDSAQVEKAGDEAAAFVKLLLKAVEQTEIPIYIAITMRSDFLGDCSRFRDLPEAINDSQYLIPRMTRDQRREAIAGPVAVGGGEIASRLVQRLLNDVGDNPDQLPILQHALMRTWDYWQDNGKEGEPLDVVHYETIGGMAEALNRHADEAYNELDEGQKKLAEKLFRCITEMGHDNREVRRPTLLKDICEIVGADIDELKPVIEIFRKKGRSFLMPPKDTSLDSDSLVDISHESLIRQWKRLREWVIKEAEDREMYERIAGTAQRYEENKGGLLHDPDLQFALEWQAKSYNQAWTQRCLPEFKLDKALDFLEKSKKKRDADIEKEKERQKRELKRIRTFAAILSVAFLIALLVGIFAWQQRSEARKQREEAQIQSIEAQKQRDEAQKQRDEARDLREVAEKQREEAETQRNKAQQKTYDANYNLAKVFEEKAGIELERKNYRKAWLYTLAALNRDIGPDYFLPDSLGRLMIPEIFNGTYWQIWVSPKSQGEISSVAFSPDGKTLAYGSFDRTIRLWDIRTQKKTATLKGHSSIVASVAFSPNGKTLASGSWDKTIRLWDIQSQKEAATLKGHSSYVYSVAFSPDGKTLASGSRDNTIRLWDIRTQKETVTLKGRLYHVYSVAFSPDGKTLASGSKDKTVRLWDIRTQKETATLKGHSSGVTSVAFSPDGKTLVSGSADKTVRLWDIQSPKETATLKGHSSGVRSVVFNPDGKTLASGYGDKTIRLWDIRTQKETATLKGHSSGVTSVAFSPDGKILASGSGDRTARLWDIQSPKETTTLKGHSLHVKSVVFSPDGKTLASGSEDKTIRLWDIQSQKETATLKGHPDYVISVAFSPDGKTLASGSTDSTIRLWDIRTQKRTATLKGHSYAVSSVAFSPDGKTLASGSVDTTIRLWDIQSQKRTATLKGHPYYVYSVAFSPDGKTLVSGSADKTVRLWDIQSPKETATLKGHSSRVKSVVFSPDGKTLASGSEDKTIRLWDIRSRKETATLKGHSDNVTSVAFSPDGKTLVSGSEDKTIRLWDIRTQKETATLPGHSISVFSVAFSPDGKTVASGSWDKSIRLWDINYLNYFGLSGKRPPHFKKIYKAAFDISPYRLEGLKLVLKKPDEYQLSLPPRPPDKTPVEWILEKVK